MPYSKWSEINNALKGIKPKISLAQANTVAKWADAMEQAEDGPESPWAAAIAQFKKLYHVEGGKWVKRKQKESAMSYRGYFTSGSATVEINALDVDGEKIPVSELITAYQGQGDTDVAIAESADGFTEAVAGSLEDFAMSVKDAFRVAFKPVTVSAGVEVGPELWPRDVFKDNAELGDVVVVRDNGQLYAVDYKETDDGFQFATRENWRKVVLTYVPVKEETAEMAEAELSESASGHAVALAETDAPIDAGPRAPLLMDVELIKPGFGNKKDKHYYPRETLRRDARVFEGVKMYATDHRPDEKSVRTEVAVVKTCPIAFADDGAPIAQVAVHDGDFAEQARNRAKLGTLGTLECSILALGRTKKGEVDGREANIVEAITRGQSVDWVTKAGAGGHALNLAENDGGETMSEQEKEKDKKVEETSPEETRTEEVVLAEQEKAQEPEAPQKLAEADVEEAVEATKLPDFAKIALKARQYADEAELKEAIAGAVKEVAKLTGSGQPFGQGGGTAPGKGQMSEADYDAAYADILTRHGLYHVPQQEAM